MTRLNNALNTVPPTAKAIAGLVYLAIACVIGCFGGQPTWLALPLALLAPLFPAGWVLLLGYIYGDARRRGMRYVAWTLIATFAPSGIGIILYFVLRETVRQCGSCGTLTNARHAWCPVCGSPAGRMCPHCGKPTESVWNNCAACGAGLRAA